MQELKFTKIRDVKTPERAHPTDAGIDFFIPNDFKETELKLGESILIPSGIKVRLPEGFMLKLDNKSGVASKKGLLIGATVVDEPYTGEVHIHLIKVASNCPDNSPLKPGDKIAQGILIPVNYAKPVEISNEDYEALGQTDRGSGGFGSTNKKN